MKYAYILFQDDQDFDTMLCCFPLYHLFQTFKSII